MVEKKKEEVKVSKAKEEPKPEASKRKKDPSYEELIALASRKSGQGHSLLSTGWINVKDALLQAQEDEKRWHILYGEGRISEGEDANKNTVRDDKSRVE